MERCYFAKEPPEIEVRGDLIFITPNGGHCQIALTAATLGRFIAVANRALDEVFERRGANIVALPHR